MTTQEIKQRIETAIPGANAYVLDPMNDGEHLQAFVVSPQRYFSNSPCLGFKDFYSGEME